MSHEKGCSCGNDDTRDTITVVRSKVVSDDGA
jgi:hypothetical protein